mgnify:CR=1 FL=1
MKLTEIESMHEQRERLGFQVVPIKKGTWIEVVNFSPHTEQVDILKRLEVEKVIKSEEGDLRKYKIVCSELDVKEDNKRKERIINRILSKHSLKLKASFAKCLVDGIDFRSIPELKGMLYKLGEEE